MKSKPSLLILSVITLSACPAPLEFGHIRVCTTLDPLDDLPTLITGTLTAIDDGSTECERSLTITNEAGESETVGYSMLDSVQVAMSPEWDLEVGDEVDLTFHRKWGFGYADGFIVEDADGLVTAVEQGGWGGALSNAELGFSVSLSSELGVEASECQTVTSYAIAFEGDNTIEVLPLEQASFEVGGQSLKAINVRAVEFGAGKRCTMSDQTNQTAWVVFR